MVLTRTRRDPSTAVLGVQSCYLLNVGCRRVTVTLCGTEKQNRGEWQGNSRPQVFYHFPKPEVAHVCRGTGKGEDP